MSSVECFLGGLLASYFLTPLGLGPFLQRGIFLFSGLFLFFITFRRGEREGEKSTRLMTRRTWLMALVLGLVLGQANLSLRPVHIDEALFPEKSQILRLTWTGSLEGGEGNLGLFRAESGPFKGKTFISASPVSESEAILQVGQREEAWAHYLPLDKSAYNGAFNREAWLEGKGISGQVRLTRRIVTSRPGSLQRIRNRIKDRALRRTEGLGGPAGSFFRRVFLGRTGSGGLDLKDPMKKLGLSHLLAASGLHVNLLFAWGLQVLAGLGLSRKSADRVLFVLITAYAGLLSFPASIVRAGLFLAFSEAGILYRGKVKPVRTFLVPLDLYLTFRPYAAYDLGLLLSFTCALALRIVDRVNRLHPIKGSFLKDVRTSFWINLFTLPLMSGVVQEISPVILLANPLAIPFFSKLFALGLVAYFLVHFPLLGTFLCGLFNLAYGGFSVMVQGLEALPLPRFPLDSWLTFGGAYIFFLALLLAFRLGGQDTWTRFWRRLNVWEKRKLEEATLDFLCLTLIFFLSFSPGPRVDRFVALDVGQGDGLLLQSQAGNFLFDCGGRINFRTMKNEEAPLFVDKIRSMGVDHLDGVFLSHRDYDHIGNLDGLVSSLPVKAIFLPPMADGSSARPLLPPSLREGGEQGDLPLISFEEGRTYSWPGRGGGVRIRVVREGLFDSSWPNRDSAVLLVDFGPRVLLMGDREEDLDPKDMAGLQGKVDLLKVAHHGSRKGSSMAFLKGIHPRLAILSSGRNNSYGHPHKEVLDRLEGAGIPYVRTSRLGDLFFEGRGEGTREFLVLTKEAQVQRDLGRIMIDLFLFLLLFTGSRLLRRSPGDDAGWRWKG
ncbi:ComEC/Rec2 family competence protein [Kallipyga massiliensis]|uniref:ComEC/Rec2 family competence protein n=1 Tax=Kallipyga massiliensis TaxID=1472764 RepID=UPI0004AF9E02|nr:ComEC/Rec2 family competence protein [Kallipyga massiliensis]